MAQDTGFSGREIAGSNPARAMLYTTRMSRARDWTHPVTHVTYWFDAYDSEATVEQLEALAEMEDADIDDLLDERLSTKAVLYRLHLSVDAIPLDIIAKKRERAQSEPRVLVCRYHGEEGECEPPDRPPTRHHFVPRWLMLELSNYSKYAPRSYCTIPACVGWHKFLHRRDNVGGSKSIAPYLNDKEKDLANEMIARLRQERPKVYSLIAAGDRTSYEWQLIQDWRRGLFDVSGRGQDPFPRWRVRLESQT